MASVLTASIILKVKGLFIAALLIALFVLPFIPTSQADNVFKTPDFPRLEGVSTTTVILEKELSDCIGTKDSYSREEFPAKIQINGSDGDSYDTLVSKRGATSFYFDKHQFSVSFVNEEQAQIKKKVLDMPKGEDWVLNGPYLDRSMLRNYIAYKTAFEISGYAPRCQYTELYIQAEDQAPEYAGLYLWIEKIRQDENRVNIQPTALHLDETPFIIAKDEYRDGNRLFSVYGKELYMYAYELVDVYPRVSLSEAQADYIGDCLTEFERNLYHDRYDIPGEGYDAYIDVDSFIDYYLINEFFMNTDAGQKSTFLYKDIRGPLFIGPVWDFNNAMGNVNTVFPTGTYEGLFMHDRQWYDRLLQDPVFAHRLILRYETLRQGPLNTDQLLAAVDEASDLLKPYAEKDHQLYSNSEVQTAAYKFLEGSSQDLSDHLAANPYTDRDFDTEVLQLKTFITNRGIWLDENLDSILRWTDL